MIDELDSEYIYTEIFRAFDINLVGSVPLVDLFVAAEAAGWKPEQVTQLIRDLDPSHEGDFNQEEFILILKYIEQKSAQANKNKEE